MSSRLMAPNVGSSAAMTSTSLTGSDSSISMSNTSTPANFLKRTAFPSITGLEASGPMLPRPSTAVPLVMTATRLPRLVYLKAALGSLTISSHGAATPGVYASARSRWLTSCLVAAMATLPGVGNSWYSRAARRSSSRFSCCLSTGVLDM